MGISRPIPTPPPPPYKKSTLILEYWLNCCLYSKGLHSNLKALIALQNKAGIEYNALAMAQLEEKVTVAYKTVAFVIKMQKD